MTDMNQAKPADNRDIKDKAREAAGKAAAEARARAGDAADTVASEAANYAESARSAHLDRSRTAWRMPLMPCATRIWARWLAR